MNRRITIISILIAVGMALLWGHDANALKPPHNTSRAIACSNCHAKPGFNSLTSFDTLCFNASGCHNAFKTGTSAAGKKRFSTLNASNRFGSVPVVAGAKQSSHGWKIPNQNPNAGASNWGISQPWTVLMQKTYCSRCHITHGETIHAKFLRDSKQGDKICFNCHDARRVGAGSAHNPLQTGKHYSHPVEVNYSSIQAANPDLFEKTPDNPYLSNPSAELKLYTTYGGSAGGAVICSTCHGPIHSADSNPYTFDNITTYSKTGNYSTSAGNLLRRYPATRSNDMCSSCHKVTGHRDYLCARCHAPHKKAGENNRYLIHQTISTPYSGKRPVQFISTSKMADRWTNEGVGGISDAICQVCHTGTEKSTLKYHRNYSTADAKRDHNFLGGDKFNACTGCHVHTGGFAPTCAECHGYPPEGTKTILGGLSTAQTRPASGGGDAGRHQKHIQKMGSGICSRCHSGGMADTGSESGKITLNFRAFSQYTGSSQKYTGTAAVRTGPYGYEGAGIGVGDTGRCEGAKCHGANGNWLTSSESLPKNPLWYDSAGTVVCGNCHGAKKAEGQGSWPTTYAHPTHAGYGNSGQYDLMCKTCHSNTILGTATTLNYNNAHVNGQANVVFNTADSRVTAKSGYTGDTLVNTGFGSCLNLYCHSKGSTFTGFSTSGHFANFTAKWTDAGTRGSYKKAAGQKAKCNYCHGNKEFSGITSAMPNYANGSPKANSHNPHVVVSGFTCSACHNATAANNTSISDTTLHANRFYNITLATGLGQGAGQKRYSSVSNGSGGTCMNNTCHQSLTSAGKPKWGSSAAGCVSCHLNSSMDVDDFTYNNATKAEIYSSEWANRGHGRTTGNYPFSANSGANKTCDDCHKSSVPHGAPNYFRLYTSDPDRFCVSCHGSTGELGSWGLGYGNVTGIKTHSWANMSTEGYTGGNNTNGKAGWNFTPKCVDCHDPHGDKNNYMIHKFVNMTGSDTVGKPSNGTTAQMTFTSVKGGTQVNWSSFVNSGMTGLCQRCHSPEVANFAKDKYTANHNSGQRCTDCHKHRAGFVPAGGCSACHGYPPANSPSSWASDKTSAPQTVGLHTPHAFNGKTGMPVGNSVDGGKGYTCVTCHGPKSNGQDNNHNTGKDSAAMVNLTSSSGIGATWAPNAIGKTSVVDDTCSSVNCHTPRSYTRSWAKPSKCDSCHGYQQKTATVYNTHTTGSHKVHVAYTGIPVNGKKYGLICTNCHVNNQNNFSTHYTTRVEMNFDFGIATSASYGRGTAFKGATTGGEFTTCSSVYCHGRFTNGTTATIPKWGNAMAGCDNCHKSKTTEATMPERHLKHVATAGYNFTCQRCHVRTVSGDSTLRFNYAAHVSGAKDVYFDASVMNNSGGSFNGTARQCANIYCHSNGTDLVAPFTAMANYTADWDVTASGRTGDKPCSFCHGNKTYAGMTAAMPNYASGSPKVNSHPTHVINNGVQCRTCHASTTADNVSIKKPSIHANVFYNVSVGDGKAAGTFSYNTGTAKCSNVTCHGGAGSATPAWGTAADCADCHTNAVTNDVDDFTYDNGTQAMINKSEWETVGHGKSSGAYAFTDNPAAGKTCTNCHSNGVPHGDTVKPFRTWTSDMTSFCLGCHGSGTQLQGAGPFPTRTGIQVHSYENISTAGFQNLTTWRFTPKCVDCHDPHGDTNVAMIHSKVKTGGSDSKGRPNPYVNGSTVIFNKFAGDEQGSFAYSTVDKTSICRACHSRTKYYRIDGGDAGHNPGKNCTECHAHERGFAPAACDTCHGYPPTTVGTLVAGADTAEFGIMSTTGSQTAGGHNRHAVEIGYLCTTCHKGGMIDTNTYNNKITLNIKAFGMYTTGVYSGQTSVGGGRYGYEGPSGPTGGGGSYTKTCSNVKCHGAGGNWLTKSDGPVVNPVWDNPSTAVCGNCHGVKKAQGQGSWPTTNAHERHAGTGSGQYDFMCKKCHSATVLTSATTVNDATHVNAEVQVGFDLAGEPRVDGASSYDGNVVVNSGFGKCQNVYCHTRGTDKTAPYDAAGSYANYTAKWADAPVSNRCSYCHGNKTYSGITAAMPSYASGTPKENSHIKHVINNGITCNKCHYNTTRDGFNIYSGALHVNRTYDIRIHPTYNQGGASYNDGTNVCSNVKCHGGNDSPAWGTAVDCTSCHYSSADVDNFVYSSFTGTVAKVSQKQFTSTGHGRGWGSYAKSGNSAAGMACTICHKSSVSHGTASNPFRLFTSDPNAVCRNCHGTGSVLGRWTPALSNISGVFHHASSIVQGSSNFDVKCVDCHDPHGDNNIFMVHSTVTKATAANNYRLSNQYGVPFTNESSFNVDFNDNAVGGDYATTAAVNGNTKMCNVCHTRTDKGSGPRYQRNMAGQTPDTHNSASICTDCHKHTAGFKGAGACNACHGYPPKQGDSYPNRDGIGEGKGAHEKHVNHIRTLNNYTLEPQTDSFGTGNPANVCGTCHTNNAANHQTGARIINFGDGSTVNRFGSDGPFYNGTSGVSSIDPANRKNCTNTRCHFQASPIWSPY